MRSTFVIIIPGFAVSEADTTCIPLSQSFIKAVNRLYPQLEIVVITIDHPAIDKEYSWFDNRVIPLNGTKASIRQLLWLKLYRLLKRLSKTKKLLGVLNFWCADNALVTHFYAKANRLNYFTWLQGQEARKGNNIFWFFKPRADRLIALSDAIKSEFSRNYGITPAHITYPGVDPTLFKHSLEKDIDIIGVGSLTTLKQYNIFIEVVEQLRKEMPSIRAVILGKGPEEPRLRKMISEKGLQNNIELLGEKEHSDVLEFMSRSKILLHPSSYEGYTIAGLEALAAGCHVVSFVSPERKHIDHWEVAESKEQMTSHCSSILKNENATFTPFVPHTIDDTAKQLITLFNRF